VQERDLVHHGLAIKRHATPAAVAELLGLPEARVAEVLSSSAAAQRAVEVHGAYALTPLARLALEGRYGLHFAAIRANPEFTAAYESFEKINRTLKQLITDWQTVDVGGSRVANDHGDHAYDAAIIDRLGKLSELMEPVFARLSRHVPRFKLYEHKLIKALEAAEDGDVTWVSDVRKASYHTVWFEMHEDLLRIMGRMREE
jgi:hypothetical protein